MMRAKSIELSRVLNKSRQVRISPNRLGWEVTNAPQSSQIPAIKSTNLNKIVVL
jgi:hypothetical protein